MAGSESSVIKQPSEKGKSMKILQVVPYFYPAWAYGGIPRVVYELSKVLVKKGQDVTVCTTDVLDQNSRCDRSGKNIIIDGIKVHYFKNISNALAYNYQVFLPIAFCSFIQQAISDFDILHLHGHRNLLNNFVYHYAKKAKKPYILSGHGTVPRIERRILIKAIFDKIFGQQILRDASRLIAVSDYELKQYKEMGAIRQIIYTIYNGIDIDIYNKLPQKNNFKKRYNLLNKKIILYLGKITPRKGIDFLVKSFAELKTKDTILVIAGNDMGFKNKVEAIMEERSVSNRVIFTGLLVGEEKLSAYQDAEVLVYPAIHEIFGLVPFESIMCGTPVIVTDDCGCGEIIGREDIGYLVKYNDVYGLRDKISEALSYRKEALEKVRRGREFITNSLNWEAIGNKYLDVYKDVIAC